MSGIDFKSFLIGILIAIIFVFTTGISLSGGGKYMVNCLGSSALCFVLNTETGAGSYVFQNNSDYKWRTKDRLAVDDLRDSELGQMGYMQQGTKPNF
tara:strand:- start:170 stop:460 length:291 start_codon:yes stop_codon:yes gene_type:complete